MTTPVILIVALLAAVYLIVQIVRALQRKQRRRVSHKIYLGPDTSRQKMVPGDGIEPPTP